MTLRQIPNNLFWELSESAVIFQLRTLPELEQGWYLLINLLNKLLTITKHKVLQRRDGRKVFPLSVKLQKVIVKDTLPLRKNDSVKTFLISHPVGNRKLYVMNECSHQKWSLSLLGSGNKEWPHWETKHLWSYVRVNSWRHCPNKQKLSKLIEIRCCKLIVEEDWVTYLP